LRFQTLFACTNCLFTGFILVLFQFSPCPLAHCPPRSPPTPSPHSSARAAQLEFEFCRGHALLSRSSPSSSSVPPRYTLTEAPYHTLPRRIVQHSCWSRRSTVWSKVLYVAGLFPHSHWALAQLFIYFTLFIYFKFFELSPAYLLIRHATTLPSRHPFPTVALGKHSRDFRLRPPRLLPWLQRWMPTCTVIPATTPFAVESTRA
jgi:hypothetical protein